MWKIEYLREAVEDLKKAWFENSVQVGNGRWRDEDYRYICKN